MKKGILKIISVCALYLGAVWVGAGIASYAKAKEQKNTIVEEYKTRSIDEILSASAKNEISGVEAILESDRIKDLEKKDAIEEIKNSEFKDLKSKLNDNKKDKISALVILSAGSVFAVLGYAGDRTLSDKEH